LMSLLFGQLPAHAAVLWGLALAALAALESSRANEFVFWAGVAQRFAEVLPRRARVARQESVVGTQKPLISE